jgi:hypothetical protein
MPRRAFGRNCLAVGVDEGWDILVSSDGGSTWQRQALPEPTGIPEVLLQVKDTPALPCAASGVELTPAGVLVQHSCLLTEDRECRKIFLPVAVCGYGPDLAWLGGRDSQLRRR